MKLIGLTHLIYYPLSMDKRDLWMKYGDDLKKQNEFESSIDEVIYLCKNNLTVFQACTLLLKHSFEGQALLDFKTSDIELIGQSILKESADKNRIRLPYPEILSQIHIHFEGIIEIWHREKLPTVSGQDLFTLLNFVAINHIIKLPVTYLKDIDFEQIIQDIAPVKKNLKDILISSVLIEEVTQKLVYMNNVLCKYDDTFKTELRLKEIRSNTLLQLIYKIQIASDPNITSFDELNSAYYEYLVQLKSHDEKTINSERNINIRNGNDEVDLSKAFDSYQSLNKLFFRSIAKNCSELNNNSWEDKYKPLQDYFFESSKAYKYSTKDLSLKLIQQNILEHILFNVFIFRKQNSMPIFLPKPQIWILKCKSLFNSRIKNSILRKVLENIYSSETVQNSFNFKLSQIDQEMCLIHKKYLKAEIDLIDSKIKELEEQIEAAILNKQEIL